MIAILKRAIDSILNNPLQMQNRRLVAEVTRLKTIISDLSYAKLVSPTELTSSEIPSSISTESTVAFVINLLHSITFETRTANPEAIVTWILNLKKSGHSNEARLLIEMAIHLTPKNADLHMRWVRQLRCNKEFDLALIVCNLSYASNGDSPQLRLNRGYLYYETGAYELAAEDLKIAGDNRPDSVEEKLVAASAYKRIGLSPHTSQKNLMANFFDPAEATFNADNIDPERIKHSLRRYGCAWIKGLFNPTELAQFDQTIASNISGMQNIFRKLGLPENFGTVGFPLYFASDQNREKVERCYEESYPAIFDPDKMIGMDNNTLPKFVFANLQRTGLNIAVREYLWMEQLYVSAAACHIRSMIPEGFRSFGEFHQDNRLYNSDAEILTLWFPFRYQHGPMPSLEFLPLRSDSHFPCVSVCGIDNEMFEHEIFWRPEYKLGDAMLLSGFSPHRTYFEADMTLERTSIDFRIFASPLPHQIYEDAEFLKKPLNQVA